VASLLGSALRAVWRVFRFPLRVPTSDAGQKLTSVAA